MTNARTSLRCIGPAALLALSATLAAAHEQKHVVRAPLASAPWTANLLVPRFDPRLGQLAEVRLRVRAHLEGSLGVENTSAAAIQAASQFTVSVALRESSLAPVAPVVNLSDALGAFDGQVDYHGASGRMHSGLSADATTLLHAHQDPAFLTRFVGRGRLPLDLVATPTSRSTPGTGLLLTSSQAVSAEIEVVYVFGTAVDCSQQPQLTCPPGSTQDPLPPSVGHFGPQITEWSSFAPAGSAARIQVPKWTPPPGSCQRLIQADIRMRSRLTGGTLRLENRDPAPCAGQMQLQVDMQVSPLNLPPLLPMTLPSLDFVSVANLGPFDGVVDFGGPSGVTIDLPMIEQEVCRRIVDTTDLRAVTNATPGNPLDDFLVFDHSAHTDASHSGCAPATFQSNPLGMLEIEVRYTVCNLAPPVALDDGAVECQGSGPIPIDILANDSKGDTDLDCNNPLHTFLSAVVPPGAGTVSFANDPLLFPNALCGGLGVVFTPTAGFVGTATFLYTIGDRNACSDTATVTVTVAAPPNVVNDSAATCRATPVHVNVFANDTSTGPVACPDPGTTTGLGAVLPPGAGSVFWSSDPSCTNALCNLTCLRFVPSPGFTGIATVSYTLGAGDCTDTATVTVTVLTPPNAVDDAASTCKDVNKLINILANDSSDTPLQCPPPNSDITLSLVSPPGAGTVAVTGDPSCANALCNQTCVLFDPAPGFTGAANFSYTIRDVDGCSDPASVTVVVHPPPQLAPDAATTCSGTPVTVDVLANDQSSSPLDYATFVLVTPPATGTAEVSTSCSPGQERCVVYTPPMTSFFGPVSFTYGIATVNGCMSTAVATVTVCNTTANNDTATLCFGQTVDIPITANDTTSCGTVDCSTVVLVAPVPPGFSLFNCGAASCTNCRLRYDASAGPSSGTVSVTYRVGNSASPPCNDTAVVAITICNTTANNDFAPVCFGQTVDVAVAANDSTTCGTLSCTTIAFQGPVPPGFSLVGCGGASCVSCRVRYNSALGPPGGLVAVTYVIGNSQTPTCIDTAVLTVNVAPCLTAGDDLASTAEACAVDVNFLGNDTSGGPVQCAGILIGPITPPGAGSVFLTPGGCGPNTLCPGLCLRFVPAAGFTGFASFTYTITSGALSDTATVTIEVLPDCDHDCVPDAQDPDECDPGCASESILPGAASLLLYPEFDNRAGAVTLLTVTNTDETGPPNPLVVEFVYIGRNSNLGLVDCEEFNRSVPMTPNDTLTVLTNQHNPFQHQGYVYVFAKNASGAAISHNHLIGNLVHLAGINTFHWSVDPFPFGSPQPDGAPTDLDNDGIRDLNGLEYTRVPDRIQIPRFLGQGPQDPVLTSALILIPLTGGTQFTSSVDFLIYNDNEQVFSAQTSVRCWDKRSLVSISGAFLETFLDSTNDAPDEIVGHSVREAGWFSLNGLVAASNQVSIFDPAILAVLIETANPFVGGSDRFAADLPFGLGVQSNGDLLPRTASGDPNP